MKVLMTMVLFGLVASASAMDKMKQAGGENSQSRVDVTGIPSPCADNNNNGIKDCEEGKEPGAVSSNPRPRPAAATSR